MDSILLGLQVRSGARRVRLAGAFVLAAALAAGCGTLREPPPSKYKGDLAGLERVRDSIFDEYYVRPGTDFARYRAVQILPIEIAEDFDKYDSRTIQFVDRDLEYVTRYFRSALDEQLEKTRQIVTAPESGAMQIRVRITRLEPNVRPQSDPKSIGTDSVGFGYAAAQLTLSDAEGGEVFSAIVASYRGRDAGNLRNRRTWGDAEHAFRLWSRELATRLK